MSEEKKGKSEIIKEAGSKTCRGVKRMATWLGRWASKRVRIGRLRTEILMITRRKADKFEAMGKIVYDLYQKEKVKNPDLLALCAEIKDLDSEIAQKEKLIEAIRMEKELPEEAPEVKVAPSEEPVEVEEEEEEQREK